MINQILLKTLKTQLTKWIKGNHKTDITLQILQTLDDCYYRAEKGYTEDDGSILDTLTAFKTYLEESYPTGFSPLKRSLQKAINAYTPWSTIANDVFTGLSDMATRFFKYVSDHPIQATVMTFALFAISGVDAGIGRPKRQFSNDAATPLATAAHDTVVMRRPEQILAPIISFSEDLSSEQREFAKNYVAMLTASLIAEDAYDFSYEELEACVAAGVTIKIISSQEKQQRPMLPGKQMIFSTPGINGAGIIYIPLESLTTDYCYDIEATIRGLRGILHEELRHAKIYREAGAQCLQGWWHVLPDPTDYIRTILFDLEDGPVKFSQETLAPVIQEDLENMRIPAEKDIPKFTTIATACDVRSRNGTFISTHHIDPLLQRLNNHIARVKTELEKNDLSEAEAIILTLPTSLQKRLFPRYSEMRQEAWLETKKLCRSACYTAAVGFLEQATHISTLTWDATMILNNRVRENERQLRLLEEQGIIWSGEPLLRKATADLRAMIVQKTSENSAGLFKPEGKQDHTEQAPARRPV